MYLHYEGKKICSTWFVLKESFYCLSNNEINKPSIFKSKTLDRNVSYIHRNTAKATVDVSSTPTLFNVKTFSSQTFLMQFNQPFTFIVILPFSNNACIACFFRFGTTTAYFFARLDPQFLRGRAFGFIGRWRWRGWGIPHGCVADSFVEMALL